MKNNSFIKLKGTIDDVTFYNKNGKNFAKKKSSISKSQIMNGMEFSRTRENMSEFGMAVQSSKLIKMALQPFVADCASAKLHNRLTKLMMQLRMKDDASPRGSRSAFMALQKLEVKQLLKGFAFNDNCRLSQLLYRPIAVDNVNANVSINDLEMLRELNIPKEATHVSMQLCLAVVNGDNGDYAFALSDRPVLAIDNALHDVVLTIAKVPDLTGLRIYALKLQFLQQINGVLYPLIDSSKYACEIVDVV